MNIEKTATFRFIWGRRLNAKTRKTHTGVIELLINFPDKTKKYISLGIHVEQYQWDSKNKQVVDHQNQLILNKKMSSEHTKMNEFVCSNNIKGKEHFLEVLNFTSGKVGIMSFQDYCKLQISKENITESSKGALLSSIFTLGCIKQFYFSNSFDSLPEELHKYMLKEGFSHLTIAKKHLDIERYIRRAIKEDLITENPYEDFSFKAKINDDKVYLTEGEIEKLAEYKCENNEDAIVADIFEFGCYTALRISDILTLTKDNFYNKDERVFLRVKTKKTGSIVVIPMSLNTSLIIGLYEYQFPKISIQEINKRIKIIACKAGINKPTKIVVYKGSKVEHLTVPKCDLVTMHTARRSAATNMYLSGIPAISVMKITGHKTQESFMKYIQVTEEEVAYDLADASFFNK